MLILWSSSTRFQVYAFGITLWELFTGDHPYKGTPRALLGHLITKASGDIVWRYMPPGPQGDRIPIHHHRIPQSTNHIRQWYMIEIL